MLSEFREFINRGNFVDLAVGFVMGVAVTGVVNTIVERLIMPLVAVVFGQPDFDSIGVFACTAEGCAGSVGAVLTALVNFLVIAFVLFLIVRAYNRLQRDDPAEPEPEADSDEVVLLREIRDAMVRRDTL
ncbi:MAG: large conductance mechanosensitive channel protein MscL [Actinobacteria bacterium]|jgi:large conductance mechanosensitive channel|nr:large conductance mechanosensitive channel protein MscL [Actinomycetota bacterium]MBS3940869.1 large conductance mechanosensitive channel protein MscL [Actinomycetota bacterium]